MRLVRHEEVSPRVISPAIEVHTPSLGLRQIPRGPMNRKQRRTEAAHRRASLPQPDPAAAHNERGVALAKQGNIDDAVASFARAVDCRSDYAEAHNNLGIALAKQGRMRDAAASFERAAACRADYAEAHNNLGIALARQGKLDAATASYRRALAQRPNYVEAHNNLGNALISQDRLDAAVASFERALALQPGCSDAHNGLGIARKYQGRLNEAMACCERALTTAPHGKVFLNLAELKRFTAGDRHLAAMEAFARDTTPRSVANQIALCFALGKAYDDCGDPDRAFACFRQGNALKRQQFVYDEATTLARVARTRTVFNDALMQAMRGWGVPASEPIFILGMPRSGSTLVEQILASHPRVFGAGERSAFHQLANDCGMPKAYPEAIADLSRQALQDLAARYLADMRARAPGVQRITDKLPLNFMYAGLVHPALPNARIIHTRRNAADTCLSCFFQLFDGDQRYAFDLAELGRYHCAYERLMDHWRSAIPGSVLIEVEYEALVSDPDGQIRRILGHCGLDWDDACLSFQATQRAVRTASAVQVRQPVHDRSIGRWRHYAKYLQPLLQALDPPHERCVWRPLAAARC